MCGIFASNDPFLPKNAKSILENRLRFRGPDGTSGLVVRSEWSTYHSRLAIIELHSGANQPFVNDDGSQLIYNGEIVNFEHLGFRYFGKKYTSDVALLNDLIVGDKLKISELDGFFAFIFIDGNGILRHACRDRFGVKPLFYYETPRGHYSFSSEPSALIELYDLSVNQDAISEYRAFRYPLFSKSFYSGILEVKPGTCLVAGRYFDLETSLANSSQSVDQSELALALQRGVASRCVSDAPVGLLLSKGIDSNLIKHQHKFDRFYTVGFPGDEDLQFLQGCGIKNLTTKITCPDEFREAFYHLLKLKNEPMSVPNEVLLYLVGREAAADGVKVLLSGEGADEFFAGYDRIFSWAAQASKFDIDTFTSLYCYSAVDRTSALYSRLENAFNEFESDNVFQKVRWFFIKYHLPVLFRRLDFSLMAAGIEGREPIANSHLFDVAIKLTAADLMRDSLGKLPLRLLAEQAMGKEFAFAKKVGFPVDLTQIFRNPKNLSSYDLWFEKNLEIL